MSRDASFQLFLVLFFGTLLLTLVILLIVYVIMSIALMVFFRKVGVTPAIAWVPFYSTWKWLEVGGQPGVYSLFSLIPYGSIVTAIFLYIGMHRTGIAFQKDTGFLVLGIFLPFVWLFILGGREPIYRPELIVQAGYPPPRAGYGSAPAAG